MASVTYGKSIMASVIIAKVLWQMKLSQKKTYSEKGTTPKVGVLNVEFALKLRIYRSLKSVICFK